MQYGVFLLLVTLFTRYTVFAYRTRGIRHVLSQITLFKASGLLSVSRLSDLRMKDR